MLTNNLIVRKSADANFIPVKYAICGIYVGANAAGTNCVIQCTRVGWDTSGHYEDWKTSRKTVGIQGTLGAFEVVTLATLIAYDTPLTPSRDM